MVAVKFALQSTGFQLKYLGRTFPQRVKATGDHGWGLPMRTERVEKVWREEVLEKSRGIFKMLI